MNLNLRQYKIRIRLTQNKIKVEARLRRINNVRYKAF